MAMQVGTRDGLQKSIDSTQDELMPTVYAMVVMVVRRPRSPKPVTPSVLQTGTVDDSLP